MIGDERAALLARGLEWVRRLPLLRDRELGLLLGLAEADARFLLWDLARELRVTSTAHSSAELDPRARLWFACADAGDPTTSGAPSRRADLLDRIARIEITAGVNRLLARVGADARDAHGAELAAATSLPFAAPRSERWWPPGVEAYGCLRAGRLSAPFFVAWDRPGAPDAHRRQRVANWALAHDDVTRAWTDTAIPPVLVVCADERSRVVWEREIERRAERSEGVGPHVLVTTALEVRDAGEAAAIWRAPGRPDATPLVEGLRWAECPPRFPIEARALPRRMDRLPEEPLRTWATRMLIAPGRCSRREWLAAFGTIGDPEEKELLRWLGRHPLLSAAELAALLGREVALLERRLDRLALCGAVFVEGADGQRMRYSLQRRGIEYLAARDGVPPRRYERHAGFSVPPLDPHNPAGVAVVHREHLLGLNGFAAELAEDARAAGWRLVWRNEAQSTRRFVDEDGRWWIRPDASGELRRGDRVQPFLLEYDRGTLDGGDYGPKLAAYARYYRLERWREEFGREPGLLFACVDARAEKRVLRMVRGLDGALPVLVTSGDRSEHRVEGGLLGPGWRTPTGALRSVLVESAEAEGEDEDAPA